MDNCANHQIQNIDYQLQDLSCQKADKYYVDCNVNEIRNHTHSIEINVNNLFQEINELKERGEKEMIESMKIIQIYKDNRTADINKRYDAKFEELKEKNEKMQEYKALVNSFEASMMELYTSQFEEGQTENNVDKKELAVIALNDYTYRYGINESYYPEAAKELETEKEAETNTLTRLCAEVSALLGVCKTKEEVEDVLVSYEIMDKKTHKLNMLEV